MVMHQKLKEAEITEQDSFLLTMNLLRIAIFNISYIRGLFPEKYFNDKPVPPLDMKIKELMPMDAESRRLIDWIEKGVYDALQRKYLKTLMFCICETVDGPMIEEYAFSFSYSDSDCQNVMMNVNRTGINKKHGGTFNSTADITPNQMRRSACKMIRTLVQLMRTLDEIPDERTIGMKLLYYNDVTPPDYEPPSFRGYKEAQYVWTKNPLRMEIGNVNSKDFVLTLKNLPMTRSISPSETMEIQKWNKNFLQEQGIRKSAKREINDTEPCSKISGHQSPNHKKKFMLWEVAEKTPSQELFAKNFQNKSGPVRDQRSHNNCWTYTGTDLFSAWRLLTEEDSEFRIFSARYLTFYANQMLRAIESQEGDRKKKHYCHGNTIARTLKFIKENGVPEEDPKDAQEDFDCINDAPEENPSVLYKIPEEVDITESDKLEDLYEMLLHQPVGADLHYFHPEFTNIGSDIYEGPKTEESTYSGLHTVLIVAVRRVRRKLVAIVKSSHGVTKGENGYMKVSLTKMILGIDNDITSPSFLVTNFTCPLIPRTLEKPISEARKIEKKRKRKDSGRLPSLVVTDLDDGKNPVVMPESTRDYVAPENFKPFPDPETFVQSLLKELASKDWIKVCESLNNTRRFAVYHSSLLLPLLEKLIVLMVMAMRNPKTALCKTLIMTCCDIFNAYGETLLEEPHLKSMDDLLFQLLMKASGDKKFVCEEADKALNTMISSMARLPLLRMLQTYVHHRNPRVRAKAAVSTSNCVSKMELSEMEEFGMVLIAQMAADLLSDKLPEAREAARRMFKSVYKKLTWNGEEEEEEGNKQEAWQKFCEKNVTGLNAQAMIKIISSQ